MKCIPGPAESSSSSADQADVTPGNRKVDMELLGDTISKLQCPTCSTTSVDMQVKPIRNSSLNSLLEVNCSKCSTIQPSSRTRKSSPVLGTAVTDIRTVASARNCSIGNL